MSTTLGAYPYIKLQQACDTENLSTSSELAYTDYARVSFYVQIRNRVLTTNNLQNSRGIIGMVQNRGDLHLIG